MTAAASRSAPGRPLLAATVTGTRRACTPWRLLGYAVRYPWVTAQVREAGFRAGYLDVHQLVLERGTP